MDGRPIQQAKAAVQRALQLLQPEDSFQSNYLLHAGLEFRRAAPGGDACKHPTDNRLFAILEGRRRDNDVGGHQSGA